MEKIMFFGLSIWFSLMISVNPKPPTKPPVPGSSEFEKCAVSSGQQNGTVNTAKDKPVRIYPQAIFWCEKE